ncbi:unnamed protein product [Adineta ricciae]|uniref:UMOD/GP2/OIT3-like D8C domain-containing protein n=1 Tax=Adineta ricciae TaxID=249248 RepID=A0A816AX95_ADIRI|nr:unnamed protein product [Adineta ricciae]
MIMNCVKDFIRFLCLLILFTGAESTVSQRADLPAQCFDHTIINDESRNVYASGNTQCDTMFISGPKWIRFVGQGGTQLSTTSTSFDRCGAQATGWYAGSMPDPLLTMHDVRVCFSWQNNSCHWTNTISVTNCGSFYVYRLSMPPVCPARYCTETPAIPTTATTTQMTTTTSTPFVAPQCYKHQIINDPSRSSNATGNNLLCDQSVFNYTTTWVRFVGEGGTQIPTSAVMSNRCSTNAGGWYSGLMPNDAYSTTNGTVCFSYGNNPCFGNVAVQVTNCGSFYVYGLIRPAGCNFRYCTDTPAASTTTTTEMTTTTSIPFVAPQCYEHQIINDSSRGVNFGNSPRTCDQSTFNSIPRWVRFVGAGGTQIPTTPPPVSRCGTDAPGWYSGSMPTDTYSSTNGSACFSWGGKTCNWQNNIQVTNCGSFFVYQLSKPNGCSLRYCTVDPSSTKMSNEPEGTITRIMSYFQRLFKRIIQ